MRKPVWLVLAILVTVTVGCGRDSAGGRRLPPRQLLRWEPVTLDGREFLSETGRLKIEFLAEHTLRATSRDNGGPLAFGTPPNTHQVIFQAGEPVADLAAVRASGEVFCALTTRYAAPAQRDFYVASPEGLTSRAVALLVGAKSGGNLADAVSGTTLTYRGTELTSSVHGLGGVTTFYCGRFGAPAGAAGDRAGITNAAVARALGTRARVLITRPAPPQRRPMPRLDPRPRA